METLLASGYGFALVLFRVTALCSVAPVFGTRSVPTRVRLALSLALSAPLYFAAGAPTPEAPEHLFFLGIAAVQETILGLAAGAAARFTLEAASAAGQLAGQAMGLGYGAMLDPLNGAESTAVSQLFSFTALGIAVSLGIHREAIAWLASSFQSMPPGAAIDLTSVMQGACAQVLYSVALTVRLAFPFIAAATFGHLLLGIAGRLAPALSLSSVGFGMSLLIGGGALFLLAPQAAELAARAAVASFSHR